MARRLLSIWFVRLASDTALRSRPAQGPFALVLRRGNADHLHCLNARAEAEGLYRGMPLADARALCRGLVTRPADLVREAAALAALLRWSGRYAPHLARDGSDGIIADVTGVPHLFGGEQGLIADLLARLERAGVSAIAAIAGSRGGAWALARHGGGGVIPEGGLARRLAPLPVTALRIAPDTAEALARLGLGRIGALAELPRAPLARRFGTGLVLRLDQALGLQPEPVSPEAAPPHFAVRMSLPEPIGLEADVMAGLRRLLDRLCARLAQHRRGARRLRLDLARVDGSPVQVEIGLARAMHDAERIAALFARAVAGIDAGHGIDRLRLSAPLTEALASEQLAPEQMTRLHTAAARPARPVFTPPPSAQRASAQQPSVQQPSVIQPFGLHSPVRPPNGQHHPANPALLAAGAVTASAPPGPDLQPGRPPAAPGPSGFAGSGAGAHALADLVSRLGNRLGFARVQRLFPADSLIPERSFTLAAAVFGRPDPEAPPLPAPPPAQSRPAQPRPAQSRPAQSRPAQQLTDPSLPVRSPASPHPTSPALSAPHRHAQSPYVQSPHVQSLPAPIPTAPITTAPILTALPPRPPFLFPPEPVFTAEGHPPRRFRWRGRDFQTLCATGPERIAPDWWLDDPAWRSGLRDYWRIETREGPRLWLFHTPQAPAWSVQGEFA